MTVEYNNDYIYRKHLNEAIEKYHCKFIDKYLEQHKIFEYNLEIEEHHNILYSCLSLKRYDVIKYLFLKKFKNITDRKEIFEHYYGSESVIVGFLELLSRRNINGK